MESFFFSFFFPLLFFFSSPLSPRLTFLFFPSFFCPPLISSSPFPLPSLLFSFHYSFPIHFLSFFTSCFPLSAPFLSLFHPFIFLISSSFSSPLSLFFSSLTQNDDFLWFVYSYDRSNWILICHFGRLCILPYPLHCIPIVVYVAHANGWVRYSACAMQNCMHDDVTAKSMFLRNYDDHFEVVLSTQYVWKHNLARTAQAQCPDSQ